MGSERRQAVGQWAVLPNDNGAYRVAAAHPLSPGKNPLFGPQAWNLVRLWFWPRSWLHVS